MLRALATLVVFASASADALATHTLRAPSRRCVAPRPPAMALAFRGPRWTPLARAVPRLRGGTAVAASPSPPSAAAAGPSRNVAVALLLAVAAMYGTLTVSLKWMLELPGPPTPAAMSFVRQVASVACFAPLVARARRNARAKGGDASRIPRSLWSVATELAFWNFTSQGLSNAGLALTTATRETFFKQLSVVITPLIAVACGQTVGNAVKGACGLALGGILLLGGDGAAAADASGNLVARALGGLAAMVSGFNTGDLLVLGGAACWSAYIFRLGAIASENLPEVELQAAKTGIMVGMYGLWALVDWKLVQRCSLGAMWPGLWTPVALALLLFSAAIPGALADIWMQSGASRVSAATTNVLLSAEPIFGAVFAKFLFGDVLGPKGKIGALLIVAGCVLAGAADED